MVRAPGIALDIAQEAAYTGIMIEKRETVMDLVLSSKLFTWNKTETDGMFTAEASELEKALPPATGKRLQYRDGEWGFYMESHRTGLKLWFKLVKEHRSEERVVLWVDFASKDPELKLRVFNVRLRVDLAEQLTKIGP